MKSKTSVPTFVFLLVALLLGVGKLWLIRAQPLFAIGGAGLDDALFVRLADQLLQGNWLGAYDETTLVKGPFYSCWLAFLHLCALPLRLGNELAYLGACGLAVLALRPVLRSRGYALLIFTLLLCNPMTWEMRILGRVLRQGIYTPLSLALLACAIALLLRPAARLGKQFPWLAAYGLLFAAFWLTREEGVWALPALALLGGGFVFNSWIHARFEGLRRAFAALACTATFAALPLLLVCSLNSAHYGWFGTVETRAPQLKNLHGALTRIQSPVELPFVHVTREARALAYPYSPALSALKPYLEGDCGYGWAYNSEFLTHIPPSEHQVAGGWFMYLLRESAAKSGHMHSAAEALAFYQLIADEINAAAEAGKLPALPRRSGFLPPWKSSYNTATLRTTLDFADYFASFRGFDAYTPKSHGTPEQIAFFERITGERASPAANETAGSSTATLANTPSQTRRISFLQHFGRTLRWPLFSLSVLAVVALALRSYQCLRSFRVSSLYLISLALLGSCLACLLINALVQVTSFPTQSTGSFAQAYPLLLLFDACIFLDILNHFQNRRQETSTPQEQVLRLPPKAPENLWIKKPLGALQRNLGQTSRTCLALAGATLIILAAKLSLIHALGSELPFMDQWHGEAMAVLIPYAEGTLSFFDLWKPHNEHRIVLTKLLSLGQVLANGQWDPKLMMVTNAFVHLGAILTVLLFARKHLTAIAFTVCCAFASLLFALPYAWENTLAGFQSQFYFLALLSLGGLMILVPAPPLGRRWFAGFALFILAFGSMSSGFLAPAAAAGTLLLQALLARSWSWRQTLALGLLGLTCLAGLKLITHVPGHDGLRAAGPAEFLQSFLSCLAWPSYSLSAGLALLTQAPLLILFLRALRKRELNNFEATLLALGLWVVLQAAAMAAGRGHLMIAGSPRYTDVFAFGILLNALALLQLLQEHPKTPRFAFALVWLGMLCVGLYQVVCINEHDNLANFAQKRALERTHLRHFILSDDPAKLYAAPLDELPVPDIDGMIRVCRNPKLQALLPAPLRKPVTLAPPTVLEGFTQTAPEEKPQHPEATLVWSAPSGPAHFVSAPLPSHTLPVLRFAFIGSPDLPTDCLSILANDGTRSSLQLNRFAGNRWQSAQIELPSGTGPFRIEALLPAGKGPFSFAAPVEVGRLSWYGRHLSKRAAYLYLPGVLLLALAILGSTGGENPQTLPLRKP